MSDNSAIQWTDATWGVTLGCTKVSDGCLGCYAIRSAHRLAGNPNPKIGPLYEGLTRKYPDGSLNWTGKVNTIPSRLELPLTWKKPRRIFVDSQSDLFHDEVPDEFIADVINVMARSAHHTFQILTKRPERMQRVFSNLAHNSDVLHIPLWPLPNVWLGVSAENQAAADERIPLLLQTSAAVRFVSAEPLLGPVDLENLTVIPEDPPYGPGVLIDALRGQVKGPDDMIAHLNWVITGGESGPNHRPFDPQWARSIRNQCVSAGVSFFHKQHGGRTPKAGGRELDGRTWDEFPVTVAAG